MGVQHARSGGVTPVCSDCGIHMCWDISDEEFEENIAFWDAWLCSDCDRPASAYAWSPNMIALAKSLRANV